MGISEKEHLTSAIDWLKFLAQTTRAFRVEEVAAGAQDRSRVIDYRVRIAPQPPVRPEPLYLDIAVKSRLTPQIAWQSLTQIRSASAAGVPTVCCPVISPRVADMCREAGVSYYDSRGQAHIAAPGFLLHTASQARRPKASPGEEGADPFAPKSSRIARVLLGAPQTRWQVQTLAREAQVSLGLASRIKDALLYQRFLEPVGGRFRLVRPRDLLAAWSTRYVPPVHALPLYLTGLPTGEGRLPQSTEVHHLTCALTQFSGAWRVAPMVRYQRTTIYLLLDPAVTALDDLIAEWGAKRVESGSNLALWLTTDPAVFFGAREIDQVRVVSPIQLYLDLKGQPGRGDEAAEEIFEKEIRPTFDQATPGEEPRV